MIDIFSAISTVFVLILLGVYLRRIDMPSDAFWTHADRLVYWVLFPSFLFYKTSTVELSAEIILPISKTLVGGLIVSAMAAWWLGRLFKFTGPQISSIVQGAGRHNTFIALAIAERLLGERGLLIASLSSAILIPVTNLLIVGILVTIMNQGQDKLMRKISTDLLKNPIIIAIAAGLSINLMGFNDIYIVHDVLQVLGDATLPLVLLTIGASMRLEDIHKTFPALMLSSLIKFLVFPGFVLLLILFTEIPAEIAIIVLIFASVPTASSAYALSKQLGGDHHLMAALITNQTLISFVTLPVTLYLAMRYLGMT